MSSASDSANTAPRKRLQSVSQRRQNKPLIEKRRRARINECLLQLKSLLMKDMGKESPRPSKLEKADILEMTVDYIKKIADKKPEPSNGCSAEKTGAPFLDGFSRCMEEVDMFLDSQLHLQAEVRHKLLSHCREQLTAKDVTLDEPSRVSSLRSASPEDDLKFSSRSSPCDSGSEASSDDENKMKRSCDSSDVKPACTTTMSDSQSAATMAFVAPFQHTSSPSSSASSPSCTQTNTENSGIKLAGPLKLICGGNVFIVVDQAQQAGSKNMETVQPMPSPPNVGGQLFYSPNLYSTSAFTTYIPALSQKNVNGCVGIPAASTIPLVAAGVGCSVSQKVEKDPETLASVNRSLQSNQSPAVPPSPEVSNNAGNDVNNNEVNHLQQSGSMWRPW